MMFVQQQISGLVRENSRTSALWRPSWTHWDNRRRLSGTTCLFWTSLHPLMSVTIADSHKLTLLGNCLILTGTDLKLYYVFEFGLEMALLEPVGESEVYGTVFMVQRLLLSHSIRFGDSLNHMWLIVQKNLSDTTLVWASKDQQALDYVGHSPSHTHDFDPLCPSINSFTSVPTHSTWKQSDKMPW